MPEDHIAAAIQADAAPAPEASPSTPAPDADATPTGQPDAAPAPDADPASAEGGGSEPFPKKALNAIDRLKRDLRRTKAQLRAAREKDATPAEADAATGEPKEDDFQSYGEYLKARQDWLHATSKRESAASEKETRQQQEDSGIRQQQQQLFSQERDQFLKDVPDAAKVFRQIAPVLGELSPEIVDIIFDLDRPVAALYTLAKEGRLDNVVLMSTQLAAAELVAAQSRGQTLNAVPASSGNSLQEQMQATPPQGEPVSQAPKPLAPAKGRGNPATTLDDMDARSLVARLREG